MIFVITEIVCVPTGTSSALRKKKKGKESLYIVSRPEPGSDPPIRSNRESGCDTINHMEFLKMVSLIDLILDLSR